MLWDPFLMKVLVKKKVCGSYEQCTGPTGKAKMCFKKKKNTNVNKLYPNGYLANMLWLVCINEEKTLVKMKFY